MAHEITKTDGLVLAEKTAWHGLGTVVDKAPTPYQALHIAGLDWEVKKAPLSADIDGTQVDMPSQYALYRDDTNEILGKCTERYKILNNVEIADLVYDVAESDNIEVETAGSLRGGKTVFFLLRLGSMGLQNGDDVTNNYAFFRTGHTGEDSLTVGLTPIRVVCANTERLALRDEMLRLRHMGEVEYNLTEIRAQLGSLKDQAALFEQQMENAITTEWSQSMMAEYFTKVWSQTYGKMPQDSESIQFKRCEETINTWQSYADNHKYQENCRGTAYAAYQAVTQYATHDVNVRDMGNGMNDARLVSTLMGTGDKLGKSAHTTLGLYL